MRLKSRVKTKARDQKKEQMNDHSLMWYNFRIGSQWKRELTLPTSPHLSSFPPLRLSAIVKKGAPWRPCGFLPRGLYGFSPKQRKQGRIVSLVSRISSFFFIQQKGMCTFSLLLATGLAEQLSLGRGDRGRRSVLAKTILF